MKKLMIVLMCMLISGCGGLIGEPAVSEPIYKPSDRDMNCEKLITEMDILVTKREDMKSKIKHKSSMNGLNGIVGLFTIVNWFLIDTSSDEEQVLKSIETRYEYIRTEGINSGCSMDSYIPIEILNNEEKIQKAEQTGNHSSKDDYTIYNGQNTFE